MAELLLSLDPTSIAPSEYIAQFKQYIQQFEFDQLISLINNTSAVDGTSSSNSSSSSSNSSSHDGTNRDGDDSKHHYSFYVHLQDLIHYNSSFAYTLLYHPKLLLPILEKSLKDVQLEVLSHPSFKTKTSKVSLRKTMSIHTYIY